MRIILLRRTTRAGRPLQVLEVSFELPGAATDPASGEIRYLELHVQPELDEASDCLRIRIVFPDDLGAEATRALEQKLTKLANNEQPSLVFKNLRERAVATTAPQRHSLHQRTADVNEWLERLRSAIPGTYRAWHESLRQAVTSLDEYIESQGATQIRYEIVGDTRRQVEIVREMLRSAKQQIVLACPFLNYDAAIQFRSEIEDALQAERTVFLIAGMGETVELDPGLGAWLSDLKSAFPDRLFFSRRSANCHAKFVVVDAGEALVTSYNFMNRLPDAVFELGVRVRPAPAPDVETAVAPVSHIARELLQLAKEIFPDYEDAQRLVDRPAGYVEPEAAAGLVAVPAYREDIEDSSDPYARQQAALWKHRWEQYAAALVNRVVGLGTVSEMIRDEQHRQLLYDALRSARRRLIILSDQLSSRAVSRQFLDELEHCLARHVHVVLVYRRCEPAVLDALARFQTPEIANLHIRRAAIGPGHEDAGGESHAKFLVCDDWAVVTSFNFLSFAGDYTGAERHNIRTEVGVLLYGKSVISSILDTIVGGLPSLAPLTHASIENNEMLAERMTASRPPNRSLAIAGARDVSLLLDQLKNEGERFAARDVEARARSIGRLLGAWFRQAQDADGAFSELADLAVTDPPFLIQAVAACLDAWPDAPPEEVRHWYTCLVEHAWWTKRDPHAVVVLLALAPDLSDRFSSPPADLAILAGRCRHGTASASAFDELAISCSDVRVLHAIAALAIPAVLFRTDPPVEALRVITPQLCPALRRWAEVAIDFRVAHPEGLSEPELEGLVARQQTRERADEKRAELITQLERSVSLNLDFRLGQLTWARIVGGPFGLLRLQEAAKTSQLDVARQFLEHHGTRDSDIERVLDEAVREAGSRLPIRSPSIIGKRRRLCLDHLTRIFRATRQWTDESQRLSASSRLPREAIEHLADTLRTGVDAIEQFVGEIRGQRAYPVPLLEEMRSRISRLLELGRP